MEGGTSATPHPPPRSPCSSRAHLHKLRVPFKLGDFSPLPDVPHARRAVHCPRDEEARVGRPRDVVDVPRVAAAADTHGVERGAQRGDAATSQPTTGGAGGGVARSLPSTMCARPAGSRQ